MAAPNVRKPAPLATGTGSENGKQGSNSKADNSDPQLTRQAEWQAKNPLKRWAHIATASAIRRGILVRPDRCSCCGKVGPVDAHHPDHADPLRVQWLARECHMRLHARERKAGAR